MAGSFRKVIFFVSLAAVAYITYAFMLKPSNRHFSEQKLQLKSKRQKLEELQRATAVARDLGRQLDQLEEAISFFESRLPPHSQIHKVLQQVTVIAQRQGLSTRSIQTLKTKDCNGYVEQPLRMELHGDFNNYYSFLLELERLPRIMKVKQLELSKDRVNEGQATAKFVVSIFFQDITS
jgi:type IV pilus assembly protein PilO